MNLDGKLRRVAEACANRVDVPLAAGCCGFAGDRGFSHPELTAAATRAEAAELAQENYSGFYSTSRTCEMGLRRATGRPWRPLLYLLERATR
jgi:D-lactate dehydrogenase